MSLSDIIQSLLERLAGLVFRLIRNLNPKQALAIIVGVWLAIEVGIPLASARNEAAIPLMSNNCIDALMGYVSGNPSVDAYVSLMNCWVGLFVYIALPGLGIGWYAYKSIMEDPDG